MKDAKETHWCVLNRYYTRDGKQHRSFIPAPFADTTGIDEIRIFKTKKDCMEMCKLLNKLKGC